MAVSRPLVTAVGGRRVVLALGGVYVALAASYPFLPIVDDASTDIWVVLGILVGGPGLALLSGGYLLPRTDVHPECYGAVGQWCLRGVVAGAVIMVPIAIASSDSNIFPNTMLLTALGSLAGLAAGMYDARAKTRRLELRETIEELETSNERLEQFAYAASHDLQEPLRMVSSYLMLVERRYAEELDEDGQEFLEYAIDGADRMREMIGALLKYSRVDTQGEPFEAVDLNAVLSGVRDDLRIQIAESDAEVTVESLPHVRGDPDQLRQVFQNLLENAIEYSDDGPPHVTVSAERNGEEWIVSVRDEGIGIDPDDANRVFEVFQRLHPRDDHPGAGIGLALCTRIVERHGGDIWVESEPGEGSTFSVSLPAAGARGE